MCAGVFLNYNFVGESMKNVFALFRDLSALLLVLLAASGAFGQATTGGGGQTSSQGNSTGNQQSGGRQTTTQQPTNQNNQSQPLNGTPRPVFLSGNVRLSDGTIPPASAVIERVCNGVVRPEAYTDGKGNFSFIVGSQNSAAIADASVSGDPFSTAGASQTGFTATNLVGCEIRANLAGFLSDSVILGFRGVLDDPQIGTIHLRRLANVDGFTFSITSSVANKDAQKAYEKGLASMKKQKWADAETELTRAVTAYPKYAVAWYELGRVFQEQKKFDEARHAEEEAIKIDPKYINPYGQLAVLSAMQQKWDDLLQYTSQMLKLNPFVAPEIYFYSAVANYNLKKMDDAESRAREAAKRDTQHKVPRINHLLALILADKHEYKDAAENMRLYLKFSPNAPDAAVVQKQLAEYEERQ